MEQIVLPAKNIIGKDKYLYEDGPWGQIKSKVDFSCKIKLVCMRHFYGLLATVGQMRSVVVVKSELTVCFGFRAVLAVLESSHHVAIMMILGTFSFDCEY